MPLIKKIITAKVVPFPLLKNDPTNIEKKIILEVITLK
tara:strand:+ start:594 stop:707 length:114 start_codon:yes stop_codon:yes gene_type:complete